MSTLKRISKRNPLGLFPNRFNKNVNKSALLSRNHYNVVGKPGLESKFNKNIDLRQPRNLKDRESLLEDAITSKERNEVKIFGQPLKDTYEQSIDEEKRPICVLVLDGGGLRGVLTCEILKKLEDYIKDIGGEKLQISDAFDLIIGTSTGGLLALGLGRLNWEVDACSKLYDVMAEKVFDGVTSNVWRTSKSALSSLTRGYFSMYSSKKFEKVLDDIIPKESLYSSDHTPFVGTVVTDSTWPATSFPGILRSYNLYGKDVTKIPFFPGTSTVPIIKAAMATSAAPYYFDPVKLEVQDPDPKYGKISHKLIDGGLNANTPVLIGFSEAKLLWPNRKIFLVSIGTGQVEIDIEHPPKDSFFAVVELVKSSFSSLFSAKESANSIVLSILRYLNMLDCVRLNPKINKDNTAMDRPSSMKYWRETGKNYTLKKEVDDALHDIALIALHSQKSCNVVKEAKTKI